jgi:heme O synthase-like polyprenyltransferase
MRLATVVVVVVVGVGVVIVVVVVVVCAASALLVATAAVSSCTQPRPQQSAMHMFTAPNTCLVFLSHTLCHAVKLVNSAHQSA